MPTLKIVKVYSDSIIPFKPKTNTDAGYDICGYELVQLYANFTNEVLTRDHSMLKDRFLSQGIFYLESGERCLIDSGIKATVEEGWEIQLRSRSGLALKKGLIVLNSPGTIDCQYNGHIGIIIINLSNKRQEITLGEPIAQIVPKRVEHLEIEIVESLPGTVRGEDGFDSTNKKDPPNKNKPILTRRI